MAERGKYFDRSWARLAPALFVALAACSGGGGGGGSASVTFSFATAGSTATEGGAPLAVRVVLHTAATLTAEASVVVSDGGTGTATAGSDFSAALPQTITFPVGSVDGDAQVVSFSALGDQLVEGADETARLDLGQPVGGGLQAPRNYTATIADIDFATIEFTSSASATADESSSLQNVSVRLELAPGDSLAASVSAVVEDAGGGTATEGSDYTATLPQTLTFTAGSPDGSVRNVGLTVTNDAQVELDETVPLALSQPSSGAEIGANASHEFTIQDDDGGGAAAFLASEGPNGVENPLAYDEVVDLGTQTVGAGPNAGTRIRIANAGGTAMGLGTPRVVSLNPLDPDDVEIYDFSVEVELAPMPPPGAADLGPAPEALSPLSPIPDPMPGPGSAGSPAEKTPGLRLSTDLARLRALAAYRRAKLVAFPLPGRPALTLELHRLPLPFTDDAVLAVDGTPVPGGPRAQIGDLSLWSGSAPEVPGSRVFLAFSSQGSRGFLELPDSPQRILHLFVDEPATSTRPATCRLVYDAEIPYAAADRPADFCTELTVPGAAARPDGPEEDPPVDSLEAADCRLAIETDYQLYQRFGSTGGLTSYVTQLVAAVSEQYFIDVQTTLSIAYLGVYSNAADPWTAQDSGGNAGNLLDQFRAAWAGNWPAQADLAHFISGANLGGGVAYIDVLCDQNFGFGVSGNVSGNIDWGTWTGQPAAFTWDFVVVAHELGHNFGSAHTHGFCPPIDRCYTNCSGSTACSQGTLMSYCHLCGGMDNIDLEFHRVCANYMRREVNRSCLGLSSLAAGDWVQYLVRFDPVITTGLRSANLEFRHDAPNEVQPFRVLLTGTAQ